MARNMNWTYLLLHCPVFPLQRQHWAPLACSLSTFECLSMTTMCASSTSPSWQVIATSVKAQRSCSPFILDRTSSLVQSRPPIMAESESCLAMTSFSTGDVPGRESASAAEGSGKER
jgi:hypothetical protein